MGKQTSGSSKKQAYQHEVPLYQRKHRETELYIDLHINQQDDGRLTYEAFNKEEAQEQRGNDRTELRSSRNKWKSKR